MNTTDMLAKAVIEAEARLAEATAKLAGVDAALRSTPADAPVIRKLDLIDKAAALAADVKSIEAQVQRLRGQLSDAKAGEAAALKERLAALEGTAKS